MLGQMAVCFVFVCLFICFLTSWPTFEDYNSSGGSSVKELNSILKFKIIFDSGKRNTQHIICECAQMTFSNFQTEFREIYLQCKMHNFSFHAFSPHSSFIVP